MWKIASLYVGLLMSNKSAIRLTDYKSSLPGLEGDAYEMAMRQCHLRSAEKLQQLCFANGGIYIKLGQVAAQMVSQSKPSPWTREPTKPAKMFLIK